MKENQGLKNKVIISMFQWDHMMELRYVNLLLFLCCLIGSKYNPNNIRLCRDDGLGVFKNTSSPQCEKIKNTFQKMFKMKGCDPTSPNLITKRKQQRKI